MSWTVPGYAVERLLGLGSTGEVWAGREEATGERVALKRLHPGSADREALRREALLLAAFRHPHVVRLRGVLGTPEGLVLVLDLAEGGSFADVLAGRSPLPAAEVGGLCAPLAQALAAAHAEALVHGDIAPANLLLDARGRPLLADLGTARLAGDVDAVPAGTPGYLDPAVRGGAAPSAASDVYGLAAVALHLLTGRPPDERSLDSVAEGLHAGLAAALDPDPGRRPSAEALAAMFERAAQEGWARGEPMPVAARRAVLVGATTRAVPRPPAAGPEPAPWWRRAATSVRGGRHRRMSTAVVVAAVAVVAAGLLVPAAAAGLLTGRGGEPPGTGPQGPRGAAARGTPTAASPEPGGSTVEREAAGPRTASERAEAVLRTAVAALDRARSTAFERGDAGALGLVYTPGSPAGAADTAALVQLRARGVRAVGLRHEIVALRVLSTTSSRARVLLTDRMPSYRLVDARGTVLRTVPARGTRTVGAELAAVGGEWRIEAFGRA